MILRGGIVPQTEPIVVKTVFRFSLSNENTAFTEMIRAATGQVDTSHNLYFVDFNNFQPTTAIELTVSYNPTRGIVADLLESVVDNTVWDNRNSQTNGRVYRGCHDVSWSGWLKLHLALTSKYQR